MKKQAVGLLEEHAKEIKRKMFPLSAKFVRYTRGTPVYIRFLDPETAKGRKNGWTIVEDIDLDNDLIQTSHFGNLRMSEYDITWEAYDKVFTPNKHLH